MEAYPSSTCLPRHLRLSVWMHRWPHITSWSCLFPVSVPEFLSCVVPPSSQVRVRDGLPVTFLVFYHNKQSHTSGSVSTFFDRPHSHIPHGYVSSQDSNPILRTRTLIPLDHLLGLACLCVFGRVPHIRHGYISSYPGFASFTQDSLPLSRIHFLHAGFISFIQDSFPLTQDSLPHTPHMCPCTLRCALPLPFGVVRKFVRISIYPMPDTSPHSQDSRPYSPDLYPYPLVSASPLPFRLARYKYNPSSPILTMLANRHIHKHIHHTRPMFSLYSNKFHEFVIPKHLCVSCTTITLLFGLQPSS
ncbi:hypothetical protein BD309DRAFT_515484 [Dichomitus squalens]|nr:hypothetical protein BD309DRAFT_515484 [Dichomitus squalens]